MNILITGGAGFIGSNIADSLIDEGHKIIIVDDFSTGKTKNLNPKVIFYNIDIKNIEFEKIFMEHKIDIIYHLSTEMNVRKSMEQPSSYADVNIIAGINILNMMAKYKVKKIIYSSTGGAIYGEPEYFPVDENHPIRPLSPYGVSKYCIEQYIEFYSSLYGMDYTILRYSNVYGKRQDPQRGTGIIAIFIGAALSNSNPTIFGDGEQLRDFVYIDDVVSANKLAMTNGSRNIFNIGAGVDISINTLYKHVKKILPDIKEPIYAPRLPGEVFKISLNIDKAKKILNWSPQIDIREGLERMVQGL